MLVLLLHAAQGQTCGPGHLELDFINARLIINNLGGSAKVDNRKRKGFEGSEYIRYGNVGSLGGRQVDLIIKSRDTDSVMDFKCGGCALPPPTPPSLGPHAARHNYTAALP